MLIDKGSGKRDKVVLRSGLRACPGRVPTLANDHFSLDGDVSGPGVWVGTLVVGSGKGVKIGDDIIVRAVSRRRNKVKIQILVKRPRIELDGDDEFELAREVEMVSQVGGVIPTS